MHRSPFPRGKSAAFTGAAAAACMVAELVLGTAPAASNDQIGTAKEGRTVVLPPGDHTPPPVPGSQGKEMPAPGIPGGIQRLRQIKETGQGSPNAKPGRK